MAYHNKKKGLALLELIVVLAILGFITSAVVTLASKSFAANNLNSIVRNITNITVGMKLIFKGDYDLPGDDIFNNELPDILLKFGAVTPQSLRNPLGGEFEFKPASIRGRQERGAFIVLKDISAEDCLTVSQQMFYGVDYLKVGFNATVDTDMFVRNPTASNGYLKTLNSKNEFNISDALEACGNEISSTVIFGVR